MSLTEVRLRRFLPVLVLATLSLTRMAISSEPLSFTRGDKVEDTKTDCRLKVHVSWGHESAPATRFLIRLMAAEATIEDVAAEGLEDDEVIQAGAAQTRAGGGDVDGVQFTLRFPDRRVAEIPNLHTIWKQLLANSDADTSRRLRLDPGNGSDGRKLTVLMDPQGRKGFPPRSINCWKARSSGCPTWMSSSRRAQRRSRFRTIARLSPDGVGRGSWTS